VALLDTSLPGPLPGWPADDFLSGNFAPVHDELDVDDLRVTGTIPQALHGAFLRNGPNPAFAPMGAYNWFDGDGMVHAVYLDEGKARYRNRYVDTLGLRREREAGRSLFGGINNVVLPEGDLFMEMGGPMKNVANTAFVLHAGKLLALWETGNPHRLTYDLDTVGIYDFDGALPGAMTAHPKIDPVTGNMIFFGYSPFPPHLRFYVVDPSGTIVRSEDIPVPRGVMIHDFQITDRHAVFLDAPACFNFEGAMNGEPALMWKPEHGCRVGVLGLDDPIDTMRWIETEPCYGFHYMNGSASSDGSTVTFDIALTDRFGIPGDGMISEGGLDLPTLTRFEVDLDAGRVSRRALSDLRVEFPRINDSFMGRANRYGWSPATRGDNLKFDLLAKYDLVAGTETTVDLDGGNTGDPFFVPDPEGSNEDDGWLLAVVHHDATNESTLEILAAQDMTRVATVHLPRRVPFGFHSQWVPHGSVV
jgi:carotenoid cleavage dioxygenase-like enzyme